MTTQTIPRTDVRRSLLWGALLAVLWVVVALIRPGTTFHLAPFLIAAAPPVLLVLDEGTAVTRTAVARVGAIGVGLSLGTALLLLSIGAMDGPAFEPFTSPLVEVLAFATLGAAGGISFGWWRTR